MGAWLREIPIAKATISQQSVLQEIITTVNEVMKLMILRKHVLFWCFKLLWEQGLHDSKVGQHILLWAALLICSFYFWSKNNEDLSFLLPHTVLKCCLEQTFKLSQVGKEDEITFTFKITSWIISLFLLLVP